MSTSPLTLARAGLPVADLRPDLAHAPGPLVFATGLRRPPLRLPLPDAGRGPAGVQPPPAEDLVGLHQLEETRTRMWSGTGSRWTSSPTTCGSSSA
ncbi:Nucleotidyltransferase domain-containing protein OS=Streptomyces cyaneofuscatus OX=66883 GN=G3I52_26440 PE=4 SV=1 [Streptomyces cyaneofuscatus]